MADDPPRLPPSRPKKTPRKQSNFERSASWMSGINPDSFRGEDDAAAWPFRHSNDNADHEDNNSEWNLITAMSPKRQNEQYWKLCYGDKSVVRTQRLPAPPSRGM